MPPSLALVLWLILLLLLLRWDPAKEPRTSLALWVPVVWMFIAESRLPSQWLGGQMGQVAQEIEQGNPLDRTIYSALMVLAIGILMFRSFKWGNFFSCNIALTAFLLFALASFCWSDFPFIALKRWFRDIGNYLVILVVLSDRRPIEAVRALLRRLSYLLIPLSVVLIKYYPYMSIGYDPWTGKPEYLGAATSKNTLGALCLLSGIFFFWDTVTRWADRKQRRTKWIIVVNLMFFALTLWLLDMSNSATSRICLIIGCLVIMAAHSRLGKRHPTFLKVLMPACFLIYLIGAFGFGLNADLARQVGRDPTLTGRTDIWTAVLSVHTNPLVGTGYQSFWLGPRLEKIWAQTNAINESHNGYLETYLNLGFIGLFLLGGVLISSYRSICNKLIEFSHLGSLSAALWTVALFYNMTEAAFGASFMCLTVLLGTLVVPRLAALDGVPNEALLVRDAQPSSKEPGRLVRG